MSTWGCYFCCVFLIFFSLIFFSFFAMWSVYYFSFLKKILNVFQKKNDKKPVLIQDFVFVPQKISKMETKPKKASKSWAGSFFFFFFFFSFTQWRREKNSRWIQLNTLPLQSWSYKWWLKKGLFLFHTGALVVYKPHGYLWVQFYSFVFLFFVPTWDGWGLQVRFCHKDIEWCGGVFVFVYFVSLFLRKSGRHHNNMDRIL